MGTYLVTEVSISVWGTVLYRSREGWGERDVKR